MANNIKFYHSVTELPATIEEGAIYFVLQENNIASLKVDLNNNRYTVTPVIPDATFENSGLMTAEDKKKLIPIIVEKFSNSDVKINAENDFNFLKNIKIDNKKVLTEDSIAGVEVVPVESDDPIQESRVEIVETLNNKFKLILYLNIPQGKTGDIGPIGPKGKDSKIGEVRATVIEDGGEPNVEVIMGDTVEDEDFFTTDIDFVFSNFKGEQGDQGGIGPVGPRGAQGKVANVDFKFKSGSSVEVEKIDEFDEEDSEVIKKTTYIVTIPQGEKGDKGDSFRISRTFNSRGEMYAALDEEIVEDEENPSGIPLGTFVLLILSQADPTNGELYYRPLELIDSSLGNDRLIFITDMSPTQPEFSVERNVSIIPWNQTGKVNVDNTQLDHPKLSFTLPRGKPMDFGIHSATIDKKYGVPQVNISTENIDDGSDTRKQNLTFNFKNMGVVIDSADGTIDNTVGNPRVTITPSVYDNNTKQKLHFDFKGIKGDQGIQGPMPQLRPEINLTITPGDASSNPTGSASWSDEDGKKVLNLSLTNIKGQDGNIASIIQSGSGNAVSDLTYVNRVLTVKKDYQFATETYVNNIANQTVQVSKGGTGRTSFTLDNILLGNGTDPVKTVSVLPITLGGTGQTGFTRNQILLGQGQNNSIGSIETISGALYATNSTDAPHFGTLPVQQGGTGKTSFVNNAIVVGNQSNGLKQINSSKGAFYSTGSNIEPQFGVLPVSLGGTGGTTAEQARVNIGAPRAEISINTVQPTSKPAGTTDYVLSFSNVVSPV